MFNKYFNKLDQVITEDFRFIKILIGGKNSRADSMFNNAVSLA